MWYTSSCTWSTKCSNNLQIDHRHWGFNCRCKMLLSSHQLLTQYRHCCHQQLIYKHRLDGCHRAWFDICSLPKAVCDCFGCRLTWAVIDPGQATSVAERSNSRQLCCWLCFALFNNLVKIIHKTPVFHRCEHNANPTKSTSPTYIHLQTCSQSYDNKAKNTSYNCTHLPAAVSTYLIDLAVWQFTDS